MSSVAVRPRVFALSMLAARVLVGHRTNVTTIWLASAAAAVELLVMVRIALAVRAARRAPGADLAGRTHEAAESLLGRNASARAVGDEMAFLGYALMGPWLRPLDGADHFSHQRELGRGGLVAGMLMVIVLEMGALHAALVHTHPHLAWTFTLSSAWAALWLLGDYQALRVRRSVIAGGVLELCVGLRERARVPLTDIVVARAGRLGELKRSCDLARAYPKPAEPTVLLELSQPLVVRGFYGLRRTVTRIALAPDERERFLAALEAAGVPVERAGRA